LGQRQFATLPDLLRGVDVCLIPYVQDEITRYRSPLKLYEYLATGKPIVSTPQPEIDAFNGLVRIASTADFVDTIEDVLQTDSAHDRLGRLEEAKKHSWDVRVDTVTNILGRHGS
jgi:glycosyltransferase involved in cell wall biosynthesis